MTIHSIFGVYNILQLAGRVVPPAVWHNSQPQEGRWDPSLWRFHTRSKTSSRTGILWGTSLSLL